MRNRNNTTSPSMRLPFSTRAPLPVLLRRPRRLPPFTNIVIEYEYEYEYERICYPTLAIGFHLITSDINCYQAQENRWQKEGYRDPYIIALSAGHALIGTRGIPVKDAANTRRSGAADLTGTRHGQHTKAEHKTRGIPEMQDKRQFRTYTHAPAARSYPTPRSNTKHRSIPRIKRKPAPST